MLNLEIDILDTIEYNGSMLCVEQRKRGVKSSPIFYFIFLKISIDKLLIM